MNIFHAENNWWQIETLTRNLVGLRLERASKNDELRNQLLTPDNQIFIETHCNPSLVSFELNPLHRPELSVLLSSHDRYPISVPDWKKLTALDEFHRVLFWLNLLNHFQFSTQTESPDFFMGKQKLFATVAHPFEKMKGSRLNHLLIEAKYSSSNQEILALTMYAKILNYIEKEIAHEASIVGVYQITIAANRDVKKGELVEEKTTLLAFLVRGLFITAKNPTGEGVSTEKHSTQIIVRQVEEQTIVDNQDLFLSALQAYLSTLDAMSHPFAAGAPGQGQ